jgi:hypothetical protein
MGSQYAVHEETTLAACILQLAPFDPARHSPHSRSRTGRCCWAGEGAPVGSGPGTDHAALYSIVVHATTSRTSFAVCAAHAGAAMDYYQRSGSIDSPFVLS